MDTDKNKLRDKRLSEETVKKAATRPDQRGTKYSQRFAPEAAKAENKTASAPAAPETNHRSTGKLKFTPEEKSERKVENAKVKAKKKRTKLQHDADTVSDKLEKAQSKVGKSGVNNQRQSGGKFGQQIRMAGAAAIHSKISQAEDGNVGAQSAHSMEYAGERLYGASRSAGRSAYRFARESPVRKAAKLESRSMRANMKLDLHKVQNDPKLKSKAVSRYLQKRRIKKQYAKAAREMKRGAKNAKKTADYTKKVTQTVVKIVTNPKMLILIGIVLLIFFIISSCTAGLSFMMGGSNQVIASTYLAEETDITAAELLYTEWETDLQIRIDNAETDRPGYDEYRYNTGQIGHDPFELISYLTAMYQDFKAADITPALQTLFNSQYQISFAETVEVRYRTETNAATGATTQVPYNWRVMTVTLTARPLINIISMNEEQTAVYALNMASYGNRQFYGNPISFNWLNLVSSRFGYRIHPTNGTKKYHTGLDIALPIGTNIRAVNGGTVTTHNDPDGYGRYIIVESSDGLRSLYGHLDTILVSDGQTVNQGDVIARSGNTGVSTVPHLHLETSKDGQRLNPVYFISMGG